MNNSEVAHAWANRTKDSASGSHFYFDGPTIYSYGHHFPVAHHAVHADGRPAVLFTLRGYSTSTAKHISITRRAASHLRLIYVRTPGEGAETVADNFNHFREEAEAAASNLARARKPKKYLDEIKVWRERAEAYAAFLGVELPAALAEVFAVADGEQWSEYTRRADERRAEAARERAEGQKRRERAELREFRAFERAEVTKTDRDYLRVNQATRRVETSQRVQIPRRAALALAEWIESTREAGGCSLVAECGFTIPGTDFGVAEVTAEFVRIGCHTLYFDEIERAAAELRGLPARAAGHERTAA